MNFLKPNIKPAMPVISVVKNKLKQWLLIDKLNNIPGILFLIIASTLIAAGVAKFGFVFGAMISILLIGTPLIIGLVIYPQFGIIIYLSMAFILMFVLRLGIPFPLGTLMDGLLALFILGLFIQQKKSPDWQIFKSPVSTWILIWIGYNVIEFVNPAAESRMAWVYTIRTLAFVTMRQFN